MGATSTASAPFVTTLVDVTGLVIYFSVTYVVLAALSCEEAKRSYR